MNSIYRNEADAIDGEFESWTAEPAPPAPQPASVPRSTRRFSVSARQIKKITAPLVAAYLLFLAFGWWQLLERPVAGTVALLGFGSVVLVISSAFILAGAYRR